MTHRTIVNCEIGEVTQMEYIPEEQAEYNAPIDQKKLNTQTLQ